MLARVLPNPYVPAFPYGGEVFGLGAIAMGTAVWPSANRAIYVPVAFPVDVTLYGLSFRCATATGNYDLGLYDDTLARLISSGTLALSAAGTKTLVLPEWRVKAGKILYAALALSSTSGSIVKTSHLVETLRFINVGQEASALPLPANATPVTPASAYLPWFAFNVR